MTNYIIVDIVNYLMLLLRSKLFLIFYFLSLKYGVRKKNTQESEDEWWARLDKRIESGKSKT